MDFDTCNLTCGSNRAPSRRKEESNTMAFDSKVTKRDENEGNHLSNERRGREEKGQHWAGPLCVRREFRKEK
jgi:hypothetical protein